MAFEDRPYMHQPQGKSVGSPKPYSVTMWLIILNVLVYFANLLPFTQHQELINYFGVYYAIKYPLINHWGYFSVTTAFGQLQLWRLITFQFLHANAWHIASNMFALFFFGPLIESYLGRRRYLAFYLICGIGGPIAYVLLWWMNIGRLLHNPSMPLVGASAGIFGILIAAAYVAPDAVALIYGIIPIKLKMLAWILLGMAVYAIFVSGDNAGGQAAHLGGAAVGWLLIRRPRSLDLFARRAPVTRGIPF